jgi:hypothetical protein
MRVNSGYDVGIMRLYPGGIDSSLRTECCEEIIHAEGMCPKCGRAVIGHAEPAMYREQIRWDHATAHWKR